MGAYSNDGVLLSPIYSLGSGQDLRFSKYVHDNVHGNIYLDPVLFLFSLMMPIALTAAIFDTLYLLSIKDVVFIL